MRLGQLLIQPFELISFSKYINSKNKRIIILDFDNTLVGTSIFIKQSNSYDYPIEALPCFYKIRNTILDFNKSSDHQVLLLSNRREKFRKDINDYLTGVGLDIEVFLCPFHLFKTVYFFIAQNKNNNSIVVYDDMMKNEEKNPSPLLFFESIFNEKITFIIKEKLLKIR